jgi:hypothetical protein
MIISFRQRNAFTFTLFVVPSSSLFRCCLCLENFHFFCDSRRKLNLSFPERSTTTKIFFREYFWEGYEGRMRWIFVIWNLIFVVDYYKETPNNNNKNVWKMKMNLFFLQNHVSVFVLYFVLWHWSLSLFFFSLSLLLLYVVMLTTDTMAKNFRMFFVIFSVM